MVRVVVWLNDFIWTVDFDLMNMAFPTQVTSPMERRPLPTVAASFLAAVGSIRFKCGMSNAMHDKLTLEDLPDLLEMGTVEESLPELLK